MNIFSVTYTINIDRFYTLSIRRLIVLEDTLYNNNVLFHCIFDNSIFTMQAMRLSSAARKATTVGEIVNLMSLDAQRLQDAFTYANLLWEVPVLVIWCMYFLWNTIGPASLAGLVVLLFLLPINGMFLANQVRKLQVHDYNARKYFSSILTHY